MTIGTIFSIKEFTLHDGPGIRTTVFFKGCPLHCAWCHNPEGLKPEPELMIKQNLCIHCGKCMRGCAHEACAPYSRCTKICPKGAIDICGERITPQQLAKKLKKNAAFFDEGGVTISGGEPLMQPAFLMELLEELRPLHRAIETSGYASEAVFTRAAQEADLILMDIKMMDAQKHRRYTGVDNAPILRNLAAMKTLHKPFAIRVPLIPGINDNAKNLREIAEALVDCADRVVVEFLPYNTLAGAKYPSVGLNFELEHILDASKAQKPDCTPFETYNIPHHIY